MLLYHLGEVIPLHCKSPMFSSHVFPPRVRRSGVVPCARVIHIVLECCNPIQRENAVLQVSGKLVGVRKSIKCIFQRQGNRVNATPSAEFCCAFYFVVVDADGVILFQHDEEKKVNKWIKRNADKESTYYIYKAIKRVGSKSELVEEDL